MFQRLFQRMFKLKFTEISKKTLTICYMFIVKVFLSLLMMFIKHPALHLFLALGTFGAEGVCSAKIPVLQGSLGPRPHRFRNPMV